MAEPALPSWSDYTSHLSGHRIRLLVLPLLGGILGAALFALTPTHYFATSRVLVSPQLTYVSLADTNERLPLVTLDTAADMVRSDRVLNRTATAMGLSRDEADAAIQVTAEPLTRVLILRVESTDRDTSIAGAKAAAKALRTYQRGVFDLDPSSVRQLRLRTAITRFSAQEDLSEGDANTRATDTLGILQTRLDRVVEGNRRNNTILTRPRMRQDKPIQVVPSVMSGVGLGLILALLSAGRVPRASHDWTRELSRHLQT